MNAKVWIATGLALLLGACASTPPTNPALETARAAVQAAQADGNVAKYASLDLEVAKKDLDTAEGAFLHHQDAVVNQSSYLATQNARLAQVHAATKADDAKLASGQEERDRIQLAARTREVQNAQQATDAAKDKAAQLQAELDAMKAKATNRGMVMTFGDVLFDTGKADLIAGASRKLDQLAQFLAEHTDRLVQIDGFTDSTGSESFNLDLSQRRADAVKAALITRGVEPSRIGTEGYGMAFPVASNSDAAGRQLNRRVEVVIGGPDNAQIPGRH